MHLSPRFSPNRSISGKTPELVIFDRTGVEIERTNVEGKSVEEIRGLLHIYGFDEKSSDSGGGGSGSCSGS
jgi:hypothetical protein